MKNTNLKQHFIAIFLTITFFTLCTARLTYLRKPTESSLNTAKEMENIVEISAKEVLNQLPLVIFNTLCSASATFHKNTPKVQMLPNKIAVIAGNDDQKSYTL